MGNDEVSLHTYLRFILKPLGLSHQVRDGLIVIDSPCDACPGPVEVSAARAWTWLLLQEEMPLRFPDETPLEDVVKAIHRQTKGKGPRGRGLVIHFDLVALRAAEKDKGTPVTIEMDRVPLCTSLRLVLEQVGLKFHVRDDGVVVITSYSSDEGESLMDFADVTDGYQLLRYVLFYEQLDRRIIVPNPEDKRPSKDYHGLPPVDRGTNRPQCDPK